MGSLVSFGVTVDLLKDVLPIDRANISTVRRDLNKIAARAEAELDGEHPCSSQGYPGFRQGEADPVVVGIDGGYVRNWDDKKRRFEVVGWQSIVKNQNHRYFGLVQTHDHQPKRRVVRVLREQGLSMTEEMTFLTDGADNVRNLALDMSPSAQHLLDWFHLTMRMTVLTRFTQGLKHHDPKQADELACRLDGIKWCLWHGKTDEALRRICSLADNLGKIETAYPKMKRFIRKTRELHTYVTNNQRSIPDYGKRWRQGKWIATSFVESTVNVLIGKRFAKSQQMQWSRQGVHHLLQTRARTLDGTLHAMFQNGIQAWTPPTIKITPIWPWLPILPRFDMLSHTHAPWSHLRKGWQATQWVNRLSVRKFIRSIAVSIANVVGFGYLHGHSLISVGVECLAMPQNAPRDPGKLVGQCHGELVLV